MNLSKNHKIGLIFASILALGSVACGGSFQTPAPSAPVLEKASAESPVFAPMHGITIVEGAPAPNTTRHRVVAQSAPKSRFSARNQGSCYFEVRGARFDSRDEALDFGREHRMNGAVVEERCDSLGRGYFAEFRDRNPMAVVTNIKIGE